LNYDRRWDTIAKTLGIDFIQIRPKQVGRQAACFLAIHLSQEINPEIHVL
jgi:hypothetical protein